MATPTGANLDENDARCRIRVASSERQVQALHAVLAVLAAIAALELPRVRWWRIGH